jgi:endo-1,4-beta-xylanase
MSRLRNQIFTVIALGFIMSGCNNTPEQESSTFKAAFDGEFLMGTALNVDQIAGAEPRAIEIAKKQDKDSATNEAMPVSFNTVGRMLI